MAMASGVVPKSQEMLVARVRGLSHFVKAAQAAQNEAMDLRTERSIDALRDAIDAACREINAVRDSVRLDAMLDARVMRAAQQILTCTDVLEDYERSSGTFVRQLPPKTLRRRPA